MSVSSFDLSQFDLNAMVKNPSILIIGESKLDKAFIVKDLMYHFKDIPARIAITSTNTYNDYIPATHIYHEYDHIVSKLISRQSILKNRQCALIVLDDCMNKNKETDGLLFNGRCYNLTTIITIQSVNDLASGSPLNFDYIFLLEIEDKTDRMKMWEKWLAAIPYDTFDNILHTYTRDNHAMVIDNITSSVNDKVFWHAVRVREY